jgi:uncharacterized protein (UPF0332 family)
VTPEAALYLDKARQALSEARAVAEIGLAEAAGRAAYLAVFHAAQALIFERTGKVPRTHRGVHAQFSRLARAEPEIGAELPRFLSQLTISKRSRITKSARMQPCRSPRQSPRLQRPKRL